jgi:Ca2+-transporting ATPase
MKYDGLSEKEAAERLKKYGRNELREAKKESLLQMFIRQFNQFIVLLLIGAAIVAAGVAVIFDEPEELLDSVMIFIIVLMLGTLGFIQEYKAEKSFEALKKLVSPKTRVIRDGSVKMIDIHEVVPGDLVLLETGDRVPADARVVESVELAADEAPLTGESVPVRKDTERRKRVFMGTVIVSGRGKAVVEKTGMDTKIGEIADMVQFIEIEQTPLGADLDKLGKQLTIGALVLCAIIFIVGLLYGFEPLTMFLTAVSLAVAAIPEGLPAVVTVALALGVQRMSKRNAIVRKLKSVETLGSADIICTDKTGTLTRNEMTVKRIFVNDKMIKVSGTGYRPEGKFTCDGKEAPVKDELELLLRIGALCNTSHLKEDPSKGWEIIGDSTEGALLALAAKSDMWRRDLLKKWPEISELPFDSDRKRMTTIHKNKGKTAYIKGAPESMIEISSRIMVGGKIRKLTSKDKKRLNETNNSLTSKGYRTLAFGYKEIKGKKFDLDKVEHDIILVGIAGMIDSPRSEVKSALDLCRTAGIRVIMVTGDHPLTAKTIARELKIGNGKVITGEQIDKMNDAEFSKTIEDVSVFARVSPAHKLRIIDALNEKNYVVAMTGDGVNDAPALKKADIGVAMGITGTDVSKESSDLILNDDNFATIVAAVEEGRGIYENIRKTLAFLISGNIAEIAIIFLAVLAGLPLPLIAIQILWINLVTDGLPAIALSADPIDKSVMDRPPREKGESIWKGMWVFLVDSPFIMIGCTLWVFFHYVSLGDVLLAQTMVFTMVVMFEKTKAFVCRSLDKPLGLKVFGNRWLVYATLLTIFLHLTILYVPFLNEPFNVKPLGIGEWEIIVGTSLFLYFYLEIRKYFRSRRITSFSS